METVRKYLELVQKSFLYFKSTDSYFKKSSQEEVLDEFKHQVWDYPLDFHSLLDGIHFRNFDENGVPIQNINGHWVYSNSMILAYGIAKFQEYIRTGNKESLRLAIVQGEYILKTADQSDNTINLRAFDPVQEKHIGQLSAMDQGQASSLFLRLFQLTSEPKWLESARKLFPVFAKDVNNNGVGFYLKSGNLWVEEYPNFPLKHTLNGALFAIQGLLEYVKFTNDFVDLKKQIIGGLEEMIPQFDRGYWSNYHIHENSNKKPYIASMKYHSLHVHQMEILTTFEEMNFLAPHINKFTKYQQSIFNRSFAALNMIKSKLLKLHQ